MPHNNIVSLSSSYLRHKRPATSPGVRLPRPRLADPDEPTALSPDDIPTKEGPAVGTDTLTDER